MNKPGLVLIAFGVAYLVKPNFWNWGLFKYTDVWRNKLSPKNYIRFMRGLGIGFVALGVYLVFWR